MTVQMTNPVIKVIDRDKQNVWPGIVNGTLRTAGNQEC
jgi:hypothetical protein